MSELDGLYLTQLRRREDDEIDAYVRQRLRAPQPATRPSSPATSDAIGLGEEFVRGVARGGAHTFGGLGTLLKAGGQLVGSDLLTQAGESMARYWSETAQSYGASAQAQGSLWDNPWLVLNPHWLTASVAESIPSLAASMVPAGTAGMALRVGGTLIGWSPAVALKLARIGAAVTGGTVGGALEGASTYDEVKRRGGSDEDALKALAFMGLASAGLNAVSLGQAFKVAARAGVGPALRRAGVAGVSEGLTEWLEEPTEAVILGEDWTGIMEAAKRGLNVVPAAILTGGGANVALGTAKGAQAGAGRLALNEAGSMSIEGPGGPTSSAFQGTGAPGTSASATTQPPSGGESSTGAPQGPKPGDKLHVNLQYVSGEAAFKDLTAAVNQMHADRLASDRATKSVNDMRAAGHARLPDLEAAIAWNPEAAPGAELPGTLRALADWRDAATAFLKDTRERAKTDPGAKWDVWRAFTVAGHLAANVEVGESILGRGMRMQQEVSQSGAAPFDARELVQLADTMRDASDVNVDAFLARLDTLTVKQQRVMAKQAVNLLRAGQHALYEAWINGLLSGPQTQVVNPLSNTLTTLWAIPERALAAQFHTDVDTSVVKGEASAMLRGMVDGFADALRLARQAWAMAADPLQGTKLDLPKHAITAGAFGQDPNGSVGRAIDYLGTAVRMPSRLMMATDAFFKAVNYRMELKALALRQATAEGLDGDALVRRVAQIEANPPAEVKARAESFMLLQTFQNDLGEAGESFMRAMNAAPGARLVLPFIKTPTNIAKWTIYRTPGLNLLSRQYRADLAEPGPTRDLALARMSLGLMVGATVSAMAGAGLITGGGPSDPDLKRELRDTGWQPYSLKVGKTYYAYNRLDPVGALVGLVADTAEMLGQVPEVQADNVAAAVVLALSKTLVNKTYLQGLSDAIEAVSNPDRGMQKYVQSFARTLVPTGLRQIARTIDPTVREARGVLEAIQQGVPGWASGLPPRRNIFGEPILLQGGLGHDLVSPIYTSTVKDDVVSAEIARHRINVSMPSRVIEGRRPPSIRLEAPRAIEGVELSPAQYDRYVQLAGAGLRDELAALIESPVYQSASDGPDGGKALMIRHVIGAHRQGARARLFGEDDDLVQKHLAYVQRRAAALTVGSLTIGR
jgi:hypothetical protein